MKPEKNGINMGLKNMSDLTEFESSRQTDRQGETERQKEREFYQRYCNISFYKTMCSVICANKFAY